MSTDELIAARLDEAGRRWRAEHDVAVRADLGWVASGSSGPEGWARRPLVAVVAAVVVAVLVAVGVGLLRGGGTNNSATSPLAGSTWDLTHIRDADGAVSIPAAGASVTFGPGDTISGSDGCNSFSGPAHVQTTTIKLGDLAVSAVGCLSGDSAAIEAILAGGPLTWTAIGDQLTLSNSAGTITAQRDDTAATIGVQWVLNHMDPSTEGSGSAAPEMLELQADRVYAVGAECGGTATGRAVITSDTINFGPGLLSGGKCGPHGGQATPGVNQVRVVFSILTGLTTWKLVGGQLTITKAGVGSLTFTRGQPITSSGGASSSTSS